MTVVLSPFSKFLSSVYWTIYKLLITGAEHHLFIGTSPRSCIVLSTDHSSDDTPHTFYRTRDPSRHLYLSPPLQIRYRLYDTDIDYDIVLSHTSFNPLFLNFVLKVFRIPYRSIFKKP